MKTIIELHPAYGKVYDTPQEMEKDFLTGKDFSLTKQGGPYCSIRDFQEGGEVAAFVDAVALRQIVAADSRYIVQLGVLIKREHFSRRVCECGADLEFGQIVCTSCRAKYKQEDKL